MKTQTWIDENGVTHYTGITGAPTFMEEKNPYLTPLNLEKGLPSGESSTYLSQGDVAYQDYLKNKMLESAKTFAELARLKALEKQYKEPTRQEMMKEVLTPPSQPVRQTDKGVLTNIPETKPAPVTQPEIQVTPQPAPAQESVSDKMRKVNRLYMKPEQASQDIQRQESENARKQRFMSSSSYLKYVSQIRPIIEKYGGKYDPKIYFGDNYNATIQMLDPENKSKFMNEVASLATKTTAPEGQYKAWEGVVGKRMSQIAQKYRLTDQDIMGIDANNPASLLSLFTRKGLGKESADQYSKELSELDNVRQQGYQIIDSGGSPWKLLSEPKKSTIEQPVKGKYDPKIFTKGKGIYRVDGKIVQWDGQNATER